METSPHPLKAHKQFGFSANRKIYRLHPAEKALAWVTALILIFQPWALGGMHLWSQIPVGILALIAFIVALLPRNYTDEHHAGESFRLKTWPKLLRFPIFWLGLIYFGMILIQIANPAWRYVSSDQGWWLQRIEYIKWLPHGVADTPVQMMNGWRTILIQGAAWILVCALWIGITRRKTARILITTIALNGVAISLVILAQRLIGADKLLWMFDVRPANYFAGSFIYKNHAGAFLILIIALCLGLAWWHTVKAERSLKKSHPGMLFVLLAIICAAALILTYARAATLLGGVLIAFVGVAYAIRMFFLKSDGIPKILTVGATLLGTILIIMSVTLFDANPILKRYSRLLDEEKFRSIVRRQLATEATIDMAKSQKAFGHGSGTYRFIFPAFQKTYKEIWLASYWHKNREEHIYLNRRLFWEHAHNDYAEYLAENGIIGVILAGTTLILIFGAMRKSKAYSKATILIFMSGPGLVFISACVDFPLHNPAVFVGICGITTLSLRWVALSRNQKAPDCTINISGC